MRYDPPKLGTFENMNPALEMTGFLQENMEFDQIIDEVMKDWDMLSEREAYDEELGRLVRNRRRGVRGCWRGSLEEDGREAQQE